MDPQQSHEQAAEKPVSQAANTRSVVQASADGGEFQSLPQLLSRYVSVWLWTAQFGLLSAVSLSLASYHSFEKWRSLGLPLLAIVGTGIAMALLSWSTMYNYLTWFLI